MTKMPNISISRVEIPNFSIYRSLFNPLKSLTSDGRTDKFNNKKSVCFILFGLIGKNSLEKRGGGE